MKTFNLTFFWNVSEFEMRTKLEKANQAYDALVRGGMTEVEAQLLVEQLWAAAWEEGYGEGCYATYQQHDEFYNEHP